jgi:hypothetical protein
MTDDKLDLGEFAYKPEDFNFDVTIEGHEMCDPEPRHLADRANELLAARLKAHGVRVQGVDVFTIETAGRPRRFNGTLWMESERRYDHTALLILPRKLGET